MSTEDMHQDDELSTTQFDFAIISRLWPFFRPQWIKLTVVVFFLLLITITELWSIHLMGTALDEFIRPLGQIGNTPDIQKVYIHGIWITAGIIIGLYLLQAILTYRQMNLLIKAGQSIISDLRIVLFKHIQSLPSSFFDRNPTGKLVTRLTNDVDNIHEAFAAVIVYLAKDLFLMGGILYVMFNQSWSLALVLLIPLPIILVTSLYFRSLNRKAYRRVRETMSRLNSYMHETFSGISTIKIFVQEPRQSSRFKGLNEDSFKANHYSMILQSLFTPVIGFLTSLPIALLVWYGGCEILNATLSVGLVFAMINYLRMFYEPITDFSQKYILMQSAMSSSERVFQLLDVPSSFTAPTPNDFDSPVKGQIEFRNVSFSYDGKTPVLHHLNFSIAPGETLALVGDTGSGKSTITSLLCRFYDPTEGQILIDGIDISTVPLSSLRKNIAIVMQEPFIFSRKIADNIHLSTESLTLEDAENAARAIGIHQMILKLPHGYHTILAERGFNLSTGQRQLINFCRALAHHRAIMILDEATASIDSSSEQLIQKATQKLLADQTSIVVAHRLSTIRHAHHILVLRNGQIIEYGNHEELMAIKGHYSTMVNSQFKDDEVAQ